MIKITFLALGVILNLGFSTQSHAMTESESSSNFTTDSRHENELSQEERKKLIAKGYAIIQRVIQGKSVDHRLEILKNIDCHIRLPKKQNCIEQNNTPTQRQAYLESLIAVMWALSDYAEQSGQGFVSGAFSIIDEGEKLYKFFEGYALLAGNVDHVSDLSYGSFKPINPFGNPFVYNRHPKSPIISSSSHFKTSTITQIGVDARFGVNRDDHYKAPALPILPYKKTHFIFGKVTTLAGVPKTFIKHEYHGLSDLSSWTNHAKSFLKSQKNRNDKQRSEKDIPEALGQAIMKFAQSLKNTNALDINYFTQTDHRIHETLINLTDVRTLKANSSFDLSGLYVFIKNVIQILEQPSRGKRRQNVHQDPILSAGLHVLQVMENIYRDGIFNGSPKVYYRTGNEVIIDLHELEIGIPKAHQSHS